MPFSYRSFLKHVALASVLLLAGYNLMPVATPAMAQTVQTYTDQAVPGAPSAPPTDDRYNSPLQAGEMTLQDVLKAHQKPPSPLLAPPVVPLGASSTNFMLQQGMQSVLQAPASNKPVQLQAPQLQQPGSAPAETASVPPVPVPVDVPTAPGVQYVPGEQPKNLGGGVATTANAPAPVSAALATSGTKAGAPSSTTSGKASKAQQASSGATPGCTPHSDSWTKTCVDAGYPESFVGEIKGETRTVCPDGSLQDVWIANSCASPDDAGSAASTTSYAPTSNVTGQASNGQASVVTANAISSTGRADASCGPANGLAASAAPTGDLCMFGEASPVSGDGPWRWNCKGQSGGMTVSCAAPVSASAAAAIAAQSSPQSSSSLSSGTAVAANAPAVAEDGLCGASDGMGTDHAPAANLCAKGAASRVNGSGPWTWACSGENGGQAAACTASRKVDGACGPAGKTGSDQMPMSDLCNAGIASAVTGDGPWNWTCSGLYGGNPVTCSAAPKRDAVCGSASLTGHRETPRDNLCSVGDAGSVHGSGPWSWNCNGTNGGSVVSCTGPISINGICGNANGVAASRAPSEELCSHGTATRVTGTGPWAWNCTGSDGGDTQGCTAPMVSRQQQAIAAAAASPNSDSEAPAPMAAPSSRVATSSGNDLCGPASELMALEAPDKDLCNSGKASDVSGNGPWSWTCSDSGQTSNCSTLSPVGSFSESAPKAKSSAHAMASAPLPEAAAPALASCGSAAGQGTAQAPADGLCSVGKASTVKGTGPWHWTCIKDKTKTTCDAPKLLEGVCGAANGSVQKSAPTKDLCIDGTPTDVQGTGPWLWTCVGSGGGVSISCSAASQAQTRIDGSCGVATNAPATTTPDANLCDSGVASTVYGDGGPWTWTCSGLNGGIAATCSARKNTPPAPPAPGPAVNGLCGGANGMATVAEPVEDLCSGGTPTSVSGNGPWNWNCLGSNAGMTVSCTAPLQPPPPITGVCGSANGVPTLTTPRSGLCSAGISSAVSGKGPWTWSCSGTNGGGAVGCVAPLAGTDVGALPSLSSTPAAGEAPAPMAAPMPAVTSSGLVTPHLKSGTLPPVHTSPMPTPPAPSYGAAPQPSVMPTAPSFGADDGLETPATPELPEGAAPLEPPPIRDTLPPSPALTPPAIDGEGNIIPGNHFTLPPDVSSIPFIQGSENISPDYTPVLDKLSAILQARSGVRITLTAYADNSNGISPREARRLSLSRALAIRDYLTTKGISSGRIDVRALGANAPMDTTLSDKVDIKAN